MSWNKMEKEENINQKLKNIDSFAFYSEINPINKNYHFHFRR